MTYGEAYDEALRKIAHLEETNGALCAEINRQERVIERQRADIERQNEYRQRIVRDAIRLSEALGVKIAGTDTEIIARDIEAVKKRDERIADLESLVTDWSKVPCRCSRCEFFKGVEDETNCILLDRMYELGLEV